MKRRILAVFFLTQDKKYNGNCKFYKIIARMIFSAGLKGDKKNGGGFF
jgi:hypothetical protein